jgi:hypothetical protein
MSIANSAGFLPKAIVAVLAGSVAGGTAAVWSRHVPAARVGAVAPVSAPPVAAPAVGAVDPVDRVDPVDDDTLQRARTLARVPDVMALIALREAFVHRATERGTAESSPVKGALKELDLRLAEARMLRLKLDADEFRKVASTR